MQKYHHANIIIGKEDYRNFVFDILLKDLNFDTKANPDFLLMESETFGIDDSRNMKKWVSGKPLLGEIKACLIVTNSITLEAQNALLKVLEEPPMGTYIFINIDSLGNLLPTFLSRVKVLDTSVVSEKLDSEFLDSNIKKKLTLIRSLTKNKDKTPMKELLKNLEEIAYKNYAKDIAGDVAKAKAMKNILTAKIFASSRGSSPKMLLEWLSCVL